MFPVQDNSLKIIYITGGLDFKQGEDIKINREEDDLVFKGKVDKEWEETISGGLRITRKETVEETVKVAIQDIEGIEIFDESGRSLGKAFLWGIGGSLLMGPIGLIGGGFIGGRKRYKSFIVIQVKARDKLTYQMVLGGEKQKDVRNKYDSLIKLIKRKSD